MKLITSSSQKATYGGGHRLKEGELKGNDDVELLLWLARSLFEGKHSATYKFGLLKSLLDNLFDARKDGDFHYLDLHVLGKTFAMIYWNAVVLYDIPQMVTTRNGKMSGIVRVFKEMVEENPNVRANFDSLASAIQKEAFRRSYPVFLANVIGAFYEDTGHYLYGFSKKKHELWLNDNSMNFLSNNKSLIEQVNYYEWLKMSEKILRDHNLDPIPYLSTKLEEITKRVSISSLSEKPPNATADSRIPAFAAISPSKTWRENSITSSRGRSSIAIPSGISSWPAAHATIRSGT